MLSLALAVVLVEVTGHLYDLTPVATGWDQEWITKNVGTLGRRSICHCRESNLDRQDRRTKAGVPNLFWQRATILSVGWLAGRTCSE